ncbi:dihydroxyacetone kinase subunit DhaL [Alteribacillus sp. YIM 98480]|uniref:dihydroxyacetone kinase subunit DhaL n=1 Tax=Alteribacillus sp. YIM 98480 TaxID=2606599 RepID=UPI0018EEEFF2|nr:dihydroxyacetone kinase subunit DhaL [Alteribacillus sp. YIM 98480]
MSTSSVKTLNAAEVQQMFLHIGEEIINAKDMLGKIDSEIGDGDHGAGMATGAEAFTAKLQEASCHNVNAVFKVTGMEMMKSMGGASGVIFGTMFSGGVKNLPAKETLDTNTLAAIFGESTEAVKKRGKASVGDKTMIDALEPASEALKKAAGEGKGLYDSVADAEEAANQGVEYTKNLEAKFGRAKTLGERALGFQDAGATSVWLIFKSMRVWMEKNE